ncbi:mitochondrial carrier domain-containing protein [Gorgonomyces haynaldii]|nr:mitochondrial carrier domain-containing protein [Gorgonomyces haynaldii]
MKTDLEKLRINGCAGGVALATSFAVMHPLDSLKTLLQSGQRLQFKGELFKVLTRGFGTSVIGAGGQGCLRLATYEYTKEKLGRTQMHPGVISALSAITGDFVSSIIKVPREVITSRLQVGYDAHLLQQYPRQSPFWITLKQVVKERGILGLFRGFTSTSLRDWPFMIILFTTYESFKQNHHVFTLGYIESHPDETLSTIKSTLFGGVSGGLAGFLTAPFDLIKTRIMTSRGQANIPSVTVQLVREGGLRNLFLGAGPRSVWWFMVCSIFFPIYETGKETLGGFSLDMSERAPAQ